MEKITILNLICIKRSNYLQLFRMKKLRIITYFSVQKERIPNFLVQGDKGQILKHKKSFKAIWYRYNATVDILPNNFGFLRHQQSARNVFLFSKCSSQLIKCCSMTTFACIAASNKSSLECHRRKGRIKINPVCSDYLHIVGFRRTFCKNCSLCYNYQ